VLRGAAGINRVVTTNAFTRHDRIGTVPKIAVKGVL
jgi:hypothetical protein